MTHDIGVWAAQEDMALAKMAGCKYVTHDILSNITKEVSGRVTIYVPGGLGSKPPL